MIHRILLEIDKRTMVRHETVGDLVEVPVIHNSVTNSALVLHGKRKGTNFAKGEPRLARKHHLGRALDTDLAFCELKRVTEVEKLVLATLLSLWSVVNIQKADFRRKTTLTRFHGDNRLIAALAVRTLRLGRTNVEATQDRIDQRAVLDCAVFFFFTSMNC